MAVKYVDNIRRYYDALVWLDENDAIVTEPEPVPITELSTDTKPKLNETSEVKSEEQTEKTTYN